MTPHPIPTVEYLILEGVSLCALIWIWWIRFKLRAEMQLIDSVAWKSSSVSGSYFRLVTVPA